MIRHTLLALACGTLPLTATPATLEEEISGQVAAARAILDPWHARNPEAGTRKLHLVYWSPSDREPCAGYQARLTRIMEHIRGFYAREMNRLGFGPRSINLDYDKTGQLRIHLAQGDKPSAAYNVQSGQEVRQDCLPVLEKAGIDADRETILIFCNLATWDPEKLVFTHKSPYYAGGTHRQGTAWQLDSPELDTINLAKTAPMIRDGQYGRISLGKHNSIFIGGIAHELGHGLSLPHNLARPDEAAASGTALMGSGNRTYGDELRKEGKGSFLTLAHALRLASHPQFSGSVKGMHRPPNQKFSDFKVTPGDRSFTFSGRVTADVPVYAVVAYCDPEGGGDYNATTATAIPDKDGHFTLHCRGLAPGKTAELRIVSCHVNGATSAKSGGPGPTFGYSVAPDGTPDVSGIQQRFALEAFMDDIRSSRGKWSAAREREAFRQLGAAAPDGPDGETVRIAGRLRDHLQRKPYPAATTPAEVAAASIALADTRPDVAKVGWGRPAYNILPSDSLLLEAGGRIFETGIYAHAPASHTYSLAGKWKRLTGSCGIAGGSFGSAVFIIRGDGKELWRSRTVKAGTLRNFDVDLTGIQSLELTTEDAGDSNRGDWALWLNPMLSR